MVILIRIAVIYPTKHQLTEMAQLVVNEYLFPRQVSWNWIDLYISQMDNNKSIGPYSIPVPLLLLLFHP